MSGQSFDEGSEIDRGHEHSKPFAFLISGKHRIVCVMPGLTTLHKCRPRLRCSTLARQNRIALQGVMRFHSGKRKKSPSPLILCIATIMLCIAT
jgi:hypothetical protein